MTKPRAKGSPHICPARYPEAALRENRQGTTELLFNVTEEGRVKDVIIAASSRSLDLDFTSAACATKWQYEPALQNGVPVEVSWEAQVGWYLGSIRPKRATPTVRVPAANCIRIRPDAQERALQGRRGPTIVRYQLLKGEVTGALVERSSGDTTLDGFAANCVRTWHFEPALENGDAATGAFAAVFDWQQTSPTGTNE